MKKLATLTLLLAGGLSIFAQPANDDCAGLIDLGEAPICPFPDTFHNVDASLSTVFSNPLLNIPTCFTGGIVDRDVWFEFHVPASGDILDFTLTITGVDGPNGTINQPQVAIYRGDCELDGLEELDCATSALGENFVEIDLLGLTAGLSYFLRISDWSASASPNSGDFVICLDEYDPVFNIGEEPGSASCEGTLYDSGGPSGDYANGENLSFTICPDDFHQCLFIDLVSFSMESGFDNLTFFAGDDISAPQMTNVTGAGGGIELQAFSNCVTVQFTSDGSIVDSGFELNWFCSPDTCTIPPPSTCDDPTMIAALPYSATDLTTCNAGNDVVFSPCNNDAWLQSEDFIFTYVSPGDECISVVITGAGIGTGIGIFNDCPTAATDCIAQAGGFGIIDVAIPAAFLEEPGTYYIVVDNVTNCTPFNIEIQTVDCPVIFPSAAFCEDALSLNGCSGENLPAIVSVSPGLGDGSFIQFGINDGCWGGFPPNFTWFFFQAQVDGDFGFILDAANPAEASDIDFQVWGPVENPLDLCDFAAENQPIRSSYAAGADPTGLANINPVTGFPVNDECEFAGGDDFVTTVPVLLGEYYIVLINDWGGQITSGAVSISFTGTTTGVLDGAATNFQVSADTALCPGESAQLFAEGGEVYQWYPGTGLSCVNCQDPVATITEAMVYSVVINTICETDTLEVEVGLLQVDAGADQTTCIGEAVQIVAGANFAGVTYQWSGPSGFLSCTDCPDPIVTATVAGTFVFGVTVTGPSCAFSDEMTLTVLQGEAPVYEIGDDQALCFGQTINLGGPGSPNVTYEWSSLPVGFSSSDPNPSVTPTESTVYYLEINGPDCPLPSFDSVLVTVANLPIVDIVSATTLCLGESIAIGQTTPEPGVTYTWTPPTGLNNPNTANPVATPTETTTYTLVADRNGCAETQSVTIAVIELGVDITSPDTTGICRGAELSLTATAFPAGVLINWAPDDGSLNTTSGATVIAAPQTATSYVAQVQVGGCLKFDTVFVNVDSIPWDLGIMAIPDKETYCEGEEVTLVSPTYEPADFPEIEIIWLDPMPGAQTPDSFFNMVILTVETNTYYRVTSVNGCVSTDSIVITVVPASTMTVEPATSTVCQGQPVQLNVVAPPEITEFTWTPPTGLSCTDCPNPTASPAATTTYTVEGAFMGCLVAASATVIVPSTLFNGMDGFICPGMSYPLNGANPAGATYLWTSQDGTFTSTDATPSVTPTVTTTYDLTAMINNCTFTTSVTVTVAEPFDLGIEPIGELCPGDTVVFMAVSGVSGLNYVWTNEAGAEVGTGPNFTWVAGNPSTFTVTATDQDLCFQDAESITAEVPPAFSISEVFLVFENQDTLPSTPDSLFEGQEFQIGAVVNPSPLDGASFDWYLNSVLVSTTGDTISGILNAPEVTADMEDYLYSVIVTDKFGCPVGLGLEYAIFNNPVELPNVFTPNGDGTNDVFLPVSKVPVTISQFQVWNRWGQLVFNNENSGTGWDGDYKDEPAASDVYVYRVVWEITNGSGAKVVEKGDVTLLR